jgi:hypothetical protein
MKINFSLIAKWATTTMQTTQSNQRIQLKNLRSINGMGEATEESILRWAKREGLLWNEGMDGDGAAVHAVQHGSTGSTLPSHTAAAAAAATGPAPVPKGAVRKPKSFHQMMRSNYKGAKPPVVYCEQQLQSGIQQFADRQGVKSSAVYCDPVWRGEKKSVSGRASQTSNHKSINHMGGVVVVPVLSLLPPAPTQTPS